MYTQLICYFDNSVHSGPTATYAQAHPEWFSAYQWNPNRIIFYLHPCDVACLHEILNSVLAKYRTYHMSGFVAS